MGWYEKTATGQTPLTMVGEFIGWEADDVTPRYLPLSVTQIGEDSVLFTPLAPVLSGTQTTRTSVDLSWVPADNTGRPAVTSWQVERRSSTDNGTTFGAWAAITGSPFSAATTSTTNSGLATGTPEVVFEYRARGVNAEGNGAWSNVRRFQWQVAVVNPPTAPTNFASTAQTETTRSFSWQETADSSVTKHGLFVNGVLTVDGIDRLATSYTWTGLTPGQAYSNVGVARANLDGSGQVQWSPVSNTINFTQPTTTTSVTLLMGCSDSVNDHGGTEDWDGWRVYREGPMFSLANRTGAQRPIFLAYSEDGPNLGGTNPVYSTIHAHVLDVLNTFYYTSATGQTHSARWGIRLYWSNGNENHDKGALALPHTAAGISNFVTSQRALYDAVHYIDPTTQARRFPDAYAGSNPTQNAEQSGVVADYLHPSARYHDFVMWSMYPPGRQNTEADPTYNWPSFTESDRTNSTLGFLIRCFYRTAQARAQARIDTGNPNFPMQIGCGEVGIGDDPDDSTTRPYYAVHGLARGMSRLSAQYGLPMPFACWWDNQTDATSPQNILSDEPATTNPSTRVAWQNWRDYDHTIGGTHPSTWVGNPKAAWKTSGQVV